MLVAATEAVADDGGAGAATLAMAAPSWTSGADVLPAGSETRVPVACSAGDHLVDRESWIRQSQHREGAGHHGCRIGRAAEGDRASLQAVVSMHPRRPEH